MRFLRNIPEADTYRDRSIAIEQHGMNCRRARVFVPDAAGYLRHVQMLADKLVDYVVAADTPAWCRPPLTLSIVSQEPNFKTCVQTPGWITTQVLYSPTCHSLPACTFGTCTSQLEQKCRTRSHSCGQFKAGAALSHRCQPNSSEICPFQSDCKLQWRHPRQRVVL